MMSLCWFREKLAQLLCDESNIWSSGVEVKKSANQSSIIRNVFIRWSFRDASEGVETGLKLMVPKSDNKFKQYFL